MKRLLLLPLLIFNYFFPKPATLPVPISQPTLHPTSTLTSVNPLPFLSQINHGNRHLPQIALTFDADMTPYMLKELNQGKIQSWYNRQIIDFLEKNQIPATIFIAGLWAETYPDITKTLSQNPLFEIANHSYSHPRFTDDCYALPRMPSWGKDGEFSKSQQILKTISSTKPALFRFPGGCQSPADIKLANSYGLTVVGWDVASGDSFNSNLKAMVNTVKTRTQNGSIILFHLNGNQNAPKTTEVLEASIPHLRRQGFQFVKVSDLIKNL